MLIVLAVLFGAASAALGHVSAVVLPAAFDYESTNTAGMMALVAGLIFAVAMLAAPRHGVIAKLVYRSGPRTAKRDVAAPATPV